MCLSHFCSLCDISCFLPLSLQVIQFGVTEKAVRTRVPFFPARKMKYLLLFFVSWEGLFLLYVEMILDNLGKVPSFQLSR